MFAKLYKTAIYARLSSDQDEEKNESIDVQIEIAKGFIKKMNTTGTEHFEVVGVYSDLGKTGSNFERKDFMQMLQEVRFGNVNCIIVKDLSRFGRNYLEVGNYIEKIFPFLGVRFISITDEFDTAVPGNDQKEMAVNLKNLVHDLYAKDSSQKAKIHLQQRRERGQYVGGPPPYGYLCKWVNKDRILTPDPKTVPVVSRIFQLFLETGTYAGVINVLNHEKVNKPSVYKKEGAVYSLDVDAFSGWDKSAVKRILRNAAYVGRLEQGKTTIIGRDEKTRVKRTPDEWVITENAHVAIIDGAVFDATQILIGKIEDDLKNRKHLSHLVPLAEDVYDGFLFCGSCGRKMTRLSRTVIYQNEERNRVEGYKCGNAFNTKVAHPCEGNRISFTMLTDILLASIKIEFALFLKKPKQLEQSCMERIQIKREEYNKELKESERKIEKNEQYHCELYAKYRANKITQPQFVDNKILLANEKNILKEQTARIQDQINQLDKSEKKQKQAMRSLIKIHSGEAFTKELMQALIKKIYIYPGKRVEIIYAYLNEMMEGV